MAIKISNSTVIDDTRKITLSNAYQGSLRGTYNDFHPTQITTITNTINMMTPIQKVVMTGNVTFSVTSGFHGATTTVHIDTSTSNHTPTFPTAVKFNTVPTWGDSRHWQVQLTQVNTSPQDIRATAIAFDEPGAVSSSFPNFDLSGSAASWQENGYGTNMNPWAGVSVNFQWEQGNNRVAVTHTSGNNRVASQQSTVYATYTGLTGITSCEVQYNVQSQNCSGYCTVSGYSPYGPTPASDGYASGTYYSLSTGKTFGWQAIDTSSSSGHTSVSASFFGQGTDFRIKIVANEGTFYSIGLVQGGTISCVANYGNVPAF